MVSAARRQIIGGGAPINKSRRRRRPQIVGGGAARHGSSLEVPDVGDRNDGQSFTTNAALNRQIDLHPNATNSFEIHMMSSR